MRPFFGSWFDLRGRKQCGYFLGHELIRELEESADLQQIAVLEDIEGQFRDLLEQLAQGIDSRGTAATGTT